MPFYRIRPGHSFRLDDTTTAGAGEVIEVGTDIALLHLDKLEFMGMEKPAADTVQTSAQEPERAAEAAPTASAALAAEAFPGSEASADHLAG